jgi:hypothetical protein
LELTFIFKVQLPAGQVVHYQQPSERLRGEDLGDETGAGKVARTLRDVEVNLGDLADWPATGSRHPLPVRFSF